MSSVLRHIPYETVLEFQDAKPSTHRLNILHNPCEPGDLYLKLPSPAFCMFLFEPLIKSLWGPAIG